MGRPNYSYVRTKLTGGINENLDTANPNQVSTGLNVWAPNGRLEQRPGYAASFYLASLPDQTQANSLVLYREDKPFSSTDSYGLPVGTFTAPVANTLDLSNLAIGERYYVGLSAAHAMFRFDVSAVNTPGVGATPTWPIIEYWNGTIWRRLEVIRPVGSSGYHNWPHLSDTSEDFFFLPPADWTARSVNGSASKYFVRITINGAAIDGACSILNYNTAPGQYFYRSTQTTDVSYTKIWLGLWTISNYGAKVYATLEQVPRRLTGRVQFYPYHDRLGLNWSVPISTTLAGYSNVLPLASQAYISQFGELFFNLGQQICRYKRTTAAASATGDLQVPAQVENDPAVVGPGAEWDATDPVNGVPQLAVFPRAKFITYFQGQLWTANEIDGPWRVRWSAPSGLAGNHRVWPQLNFEEIIDGDNSPITGLRGFQQNMCVFKQDSITQLIFSGDVDGLATYGVEQTVSGIGTHSHHSIAEIRGKLVFLWEDGIYAFNGTPAVENLCLDKETGANRLQKIMKRVTASRREFAVGVNWRSKGCYLLGVSLDGANYNNYTLVYDYNNDAWWLWDLPAQLWMLDEDGADNEKLLFVNDVGAVCELGIGHNDHGTDIDWKVVTQPLLDDGKTRRLRVVEVDSTNQVLDLSLEVLVDNQRPANEVSTAGGVLYFDDAAEHVFSEYRANWDTKTGTTHTAATYSTSSYGVERDRRRAWGCNYLGKKFQVHLGQGVRTGLGPTPFALNELQLGYVPVGKR